MDSTIPINKKTENSLSAKERLTAKIRANYRAPDQDFSVCLKSGEFEQTVALFYVANMLLDKISEEDAAYLLQFADPLDVLADHWRMMHMEKEMQDYDAKLLVQEIRNVGHADIYQKVTDCDTANR